MFNLIKVILFMLLISLSFQAQTTYKVVTIVDNFSAYSETLFIELDVPAPPSVSVTDYSLTTSNSKSLLGEERDLILTFNEGYAGSVLSCAVQGGTLNLATGTDSVGTLVIQYDGTDASPSLNPTGLNGINLLANYATAFNIQSQSDHDTIITIRVYSSENEISTLSMQISENILTDYLFEFNKFIGNANFKNVGAIEIEMEARENVDAVISSFTVVSPRVYLLGAMNEISPYNFDLQCIPTATSNNVNNEESEEESKESTSLFESISSSTSSVSISDVKILFSNIAELIDSSESTISSFFSTSHTIHSNHLSDEIETSSASSLTFSILILLVISLLI